MSDYKEIPQAIAEEIAQEEYDKDFYDLDEKTKDLVYKKAEEKFVDGATGFADGMRKDRLQANAIL